MKVCPEKILQQEVTNNLSFPGEWTTRFMCKSPDTSFCFFLEQAEKTPKTFAVLAKICAKLLKNQRLC